MIVQLATALVFFTGEGVDPSSAQAVQAAVRERLAREGGELVDLSAENRALLKPRLFVDFTAPPPVPLPPELMESWKAGSEACASQTGPTGPELQPLARTQAAATARACQEALGQAAWDALLEHRKLARVLELELRTLSGSSSLVANLHEPGARRRTLLLEHLSADRLAVSAAGMVGELLAGAGKSRAAPRRPFPSLGVPVIESDVSGPTADMSVPRACGPLPARLEVFPLGPFTRAIEAAYKTVPASRRTGKPRRCDLVLYPSYPPGPVKAAFARLACPPFQLRAGVMIEGDPRAAGSKLISDLVNEAVAALCAR
jgi:hypothetical protein